jgi:hypothetical protein
LRSEEELNAWLLPTLDTTQAQLTEVARAQASYWRATLRRGQLPDAWQDWPRVFIQDAVPYVYPPLRWRAERALAWQLQEALEVIQQGPESQEQLQPGSRLWDNAYLYEYLRHTVYLLPERQQLQRKLDQLQRLTRISPMGVKVGQ